VTGLFDRVKEVCSVGRVGKKTANAKHHFHMLILSQIRLYVCEIWYLYTSPIFGMFLSGCHVVRYLCQRPHAYPSVLGAVQST
jgi:hypothetical protein